MELLNHEDLLACSIRAFSNNKNLLDDVLNEIGNSPIEEPHVPAPYFCKCKNCRLMPTDAENKCCGERNCRAITQRFLLICIDRENVETGIRNFTTSFVEVAMYNNRGMRHGAYRQYVMWQCGYLGKGRRVVIPACCVWAIRKVYPSENGIYRGYVP